MLRFDHRPAEYILQAFEMTNVSAILVIWQLLYWQFYLIFYFFWQDRELVPWGTVYEGAICHGQCHVYFQSFAKMNGYDFHKKRNSIFFLKAKSIHCLRRTLMFFLLLKRFVKSVLFLGWVIPSLDWAVCREVC